MRRDQPAQGNPLNRESEIFQGARAERALTAVRTLRPRFSQPLTRPECLHFTSGVVVCSPRNPSKNRLPASMFCSGVRPVRSRRRAIRRRSRPLLRISAPCPRCRHRVERFHSRRARGPELRRGDETSLSGRRAETAPPSGQRRWRGARLPRTRTGLSKRVIEYISYPYTSTSLLSL